MFVLEFVPQAGTVSLVQYGAVGVPVVSPATWMRGTEPGRCWTDIGLEDRLWPDAIELFNVDPWPLEFR